MNFVAGDLFAQAPQLILLLGALSVLVTQFIVRKNAASAAWGLAVLTLFAALAVVSFGLSDVAGRVTYLPRVFSGVETVTALGGSLRYTSFSSNGIFLLLAITIFAVLPMRSQLRKVNLHFAENYFLILASVAGYAYALCAEDLITLFVAIELGSLPLLVLLGMNRQSAEANEAALKYLLLSAFAIAFFLLGLALLYGITGSVRLHDIKEMAPHFLKTRATMLAYAVIFAGLFFKITAFPMHGYAADVYSGATASFVGLFATLAKIAGVLIAFKISFGIHDLYRPYLAPIFTFAAMGSMLFGAFASLRPSNIRRILAYSSITNAGYMLCLFVVPATYDAALIGTLKQEAGAALYIFSAGYAAATLLAFVIIAEFENEAGIPADIANIQGLTSKSRALRWPLAIALLSSMGIPPLAGFFSKFFLFRYIALSGNYYLAACAALASGIAVYAYIRILKPLFFETETVETGSVPVRQDVSLTFSIYMLAAVVLFFLVGISFLYNMGIIASQKIY